MWKPPTGSEDPLRGNGLDLLDRGGPPSLAPYAFSEGVAQLLVCPTRSSNGIHSTWVELTHGLRQDNAPQSRQASRQTFFNERAFHFASGEAAPSRAWPLRQMFRRSLTESGLFPREQPAPASLASFKSQNRTNQARGNERLSGSAASSSHANFVSN